MITASGHLCQAKAKMIHPALYCIKPLILAQNDRPGSQLNYNFFQAQMIHFTKTVNMISKYHNYKRQTNPWHQEDKQSKATNSLFPLEMIAKLQWTQSYVQQNIEQLQNLNYDLTIYCILTHFPNQPHWPFTLLHPDTFPTPNNWHV